MELLPEDLFFTSKEEPKKRANDLNGREWIKHSISIWSELAKDSEEKKLNHPAIFPWKLAHKIIETFTDETKRNILDPFLGSGSTLVACKKLNKHGIGFELNKDYIDISKGRLKILNLKDKKKSILHIIKDNAMNMGKYLPENIIDLCFTSPPYWNILNQKRSADNKDIKDYKFSKENIGQISSYEEYLFIMQSIFYEVFKVLKLNSYCVINVMDLRKKSCFYPLHMDISSIMKEIGFILDDIIIWDRRHEYNNLRPLGYPYVFRVNKVHEFLLIFKKCQN